MKITIQPKTRAGKCSAVLFIIFILLKTAAGIISSVQENTIEYPTPLNSPLLGTTIYLMFTAAIITSITGLIAVGKNNERSILVYISIPLGIAYFIGILMLLIGNIIGPPSQ